MGKLIIICIVLYGFWVIGYALYEMSRKGKKKPSKTGLKDPHRELSVEQILGKCRSVECHSQPQVRSYPQTGNRAKNDSIFAGEKKNEPSGTPSEDLSTEVYSEQEIGEVRLEYEAPNAKTDVTLNLGEEEAEDLISVNGKVEYAGGIDVGLLMEAFASLHSESATTQQQQRAAKLLHQLKSSTMMDALRADPKRAKKIDELISRRFTELSKVMPQSDESDRVSDEGADGFNITDYLPS